jgi:hypothetical protein
LWRWGDSVICRRLGRRMPWLMGWKWKGLDVGVDFLLELIFCWMLIFGDFFCGRRFH